MRKNEIWLAAAALLTLAAGLGLRDPWAPDEPRYALIAAEMLQSGNWSVTHLGGLVYAQKPPVYFWTSGCGRMAGRPSTRLSPALAAGRPGQPDAGLGPGAKALVQGDRLVGGAGAVGLRTVQHAGPRRADRCLAVLLHHAGPVRNTATPAAGAGLALVCARLPHQPEWVS